MREIYITPDVKGSVTINIVDNPYIRHEYLSDEELKKLQSEISKYLGGK